MQPPSSSQFSAPGQVLDKGQIIILAKLEALSLTLARRPGLFQRASPRGLYIHGSVGRGKSMLMDRFFATAPISNKRRVHFNAFMLDVHARLHAVRAAGRQDPLAPVAAALAKEARLLCFDEFQVNDIADAMILKRLFEGLLAKGVIIVATSNAAPGDLYPNGLQRTLFLPFIALLKEKLDVLRMGDGRDYRLDRLKGRRVWFAPDDSLADTAFDELWRDLAGGHESQPATLNVGGRILAIPAATSGVTSGAARLTFDDLCRQPLGAADYLVVASRYAVVFVAHIPCFAPAPRNEAQRFITLIDQLYEQKTRLVATAMAEPLQLYPPGGPLAGAFQRTASRLMEMQSAAWLENEI